MAESWRGLSCGSERENVKLILEREEEQVQNRQIVNCAHGDFKWMRGAVLGKRWVGWYAVGKLCRCLGVSYGLFRGIGSIAKRRSQVCAE